MRRGKYGLDAPYALAIFAGATAIAGISSLTSILRGSPQTALVIGLYFLFFLSNTTSFWYTTRHGKFIEWARILEQLKLRGDEAVLDMGCGRGAVLTAVARKLTTGIVTGVDIWKTMHQSGMPWRSSCATHPSKGFRIECRSKPGIFVLFRFRTPVLR